MVIQQVHVHYVMSTVKLVIQQLTSVLLAVLARWVINFSFILIQFAIRLALLAIMEIHQQKIVKAVMPPAMDV